MSEATRETRWGLYPWFEEHGAGFVHPDDLGAFRALLPYGKVFTCRALEGPHLVLTYGPLRFRVLPALFQDVKPLAVGIGERVMTSQGLIGTVREIGWHFHREEPFFLLSVDGRPENRRFWTRDLRACPRSASE